MADDIEREDMRQWLEERTELNKNTERLPYGYKQYKDVDDEIVRQVPHDDEWNDWDKVIDEGDEEEPYIPPMSEQEEAEIDNILAAK